MKLSIKALSAVIVTVSIMFYACTKSGNVVVQSQIRPATQQSSNIQGAPGISFCGSQEEEPLTAGQNIPAGSLVIENDSDNLYVTYNTTGDWKLSEVHLNVVCNNGGDCIQTKSSALAPGKFPYSQVFSSSSGSCSIGELPVTYTFTIPRTALGDCSCFCVYPHAVVERCVDGTTLESQTAWGGGYKKLTNGKWYASTSYCMQTCEVIIVK